MDYAKKLSHLEVKHKRQHEVVEVLIAEKAPEMAILSAKQEKLRIKDQIHHLYALYESDSGLENFG